MVEVSFPRAKVVELDIPRWLSLLVVFSVSCSVFAALCLKSNPYLTSTDGFADGGDMYSHQVEALYFKELLQSGSTDFWFDEVTLGYPLFLAYQPFPCLFTTSMMSLAESLHISPLLMFRWLFAILLSAMPWLWYVGLRKLGLTNLEATLAAVFVHSIHSWRKFGLELGAFQEYGLFTQAYGMASLPLAVGFLYSYVMHGDGSRNGAILVVILNFLCHAFCGIYVGMTTAVMVVVDLFCNSLPLKKKLFSPSLWRAINVHLASVVLMSWWLVPLLLNYSYIGGLPWKNESENGYDFGFVLKHLMSGEMFDHGRTFPFLTIGLLAGLACICFSQQQNHENLEESKRQLLFVWLGTLFFVTLLLFLGRTLSGPLYNLLPFHKEIEVVRYLSGIHFCGLLLMAISSSRVLCFLCAKLSQISYNLVKSGQILVAVMLVLPPFYLSSQLEVINSRLSVTDITDLPEALKQMKAYPDQGRVLGHKQLGTGGPWNLALIPHLCRKPGILTYSRGYHDSLSLYYLELMETNLDSTPWLPDLLRLYNIRFLITSGIQVPSDFLEACQLRNLASMDSMDVFVRDPGQEYGYFEFAHVPGAIMGDLKGMREAVFRSTRLFTHNVVLAINPSEELDNAPSKIKVTGTNFNAPRFLPSDVFTTKWFVNNRSVQEESFFAEMRSGYQSKRVMSRVLREEVGRTSYFAHVHVTRRASDENFYSTEHLILKVTYHPYWTCAFQTSDDVNAPSSSADGFDQSHNWQDIRVHHVTPNLMSMVLPPGGHHVMCQYKNPVYQKIGFILFIGVCVVLVVRELLNGLQGKR